VSTPDTGDKSTVNRPRVLLVEDNDAAGKGLSKILSALGYEVAVVFDGASALEALRQLPPPDFLLTDLRLPDLDGREVALAASRLAPSPHVALITGWDLDHDLLEIASWGIDWVFTKPLNVQELVSKLRESEPGPKPATLPKSLGDGDGKG
jgi:two-component system, cell cycle response regulator CpdR